MHVQCLSNTDVCDLVCIRCASRPTKGDQGTQGVQLKDHFVSADFLLQAQFYCHVLCLCVVDFVFDIQLIVSSSN